MIRQIKIFFGIYDLHEEGKLWVKKNIGEEWVDDFSRKYIAINKGIPIGNYVETIIFLRMVEDIKEELYSKSWKGIFKKKGKKKDVKDN